MDASALGIPVGAEIYTLAGHTARIGPNGAFRYEGRDYSFTELCALLSPTGRINPRLFFWNGVRLWDLQRRRMGRAA